MATLADDGSVASGILSLAPLSGSSGLGFFDGRFLISRRSLLLAWLNISSTCAAVAWWRAVAEGRTADTLLILLFIPMDVCCSLIRFFFALVLDLYCGCSMSRMLDRSKLWNCVRNAREYSCFIPSCDNSSLCGATIIEQIVHTFGLSSHEQYGLPPRTIGHLPCGQTLHTGSHVLRHRQSTTMMRTRGLAAGYSLIWTVHCPF